MLNRSLRQEPAEKPVSDSVSPRSLHEVLFDDANTADAVSFEFETTNPSNGNLATIFRIFRRKRFIATVGILILAAIGFTIDEAGYLDLATIFNFLRAHPILAPVAFIALSFIMTLLMLPTLPLNLGAGFLWGPYFGGLYTLVGASLGAAIAFLISRHLAAELLNRHFRHRTWIWLLEQVRQQDWKVVAFTRINPIFPTAPLNYFFGLTTIKFWPYLIATVVFIAPMVVLFAHLGDAVGGFVLRGSAHQFVQNILGVSAAISMLVLLRVALKRLLKVALAKTKVAQVKRD